MRLKSLAEPFSHGETCVEVSASIGITAYPESGATANKLIFAADSVMYIAKTAGGNIYRYYSQEINDALVRSNRLEPPLGTAIRRQEYGFAIYCRWTAGLVTWLVWRGTAALAASAVRRCRAAGVGLSWSARN
jgi:predicted signal transduction protein with EAL and GGDEF domain